ncbi:MAG: dihydrofolate reductase family protein [Dermabacter sp.]|nr:dihydrofolate reductase family protein [Dermabacter sp.]
MRTPRTWTGRVFIGSSLDGYISRPDGAIEWLTDPEPGRNHAEIGSTTEAAGWDLFFPSVDHLVMGRGTYEKVLTFDHWPFTGKRVIVLSTTLSPDDARVTVVRSLNDAVQELAATDADQVYVDGGQVIQSFLREGLIDEITIGWAPVLIGSGRRLFGDLAEDVLLELVASHASADGMVHATYRIHRPERSDARSAA